jgi:signal transduction histidine kinase
MTQQELYDVWGKYYRLVQDKRKVLGSGLGLSIVKSILELHNVRYGVRSIKGKGSNFWFELPCVDEKDLPGDDEA